MRTVRASRASAVMGLPLTDNELEKVRKKIEKTLKQQVGGVLRA